MSAPRSTAPVSRCPWPTTPLYIAYHDREWGVPVRDDCELFQHLILDGAQAGLSWLTILNKRENYRVAFDQFDPEKIARYDERKVAALLTNPGIVRNRLKIASAITNARAFLAVQESGTGFSELLWQFVGGRTIQHARRTMAEVPARTPESDAMSRELGAHGFKFVGSTICYAFMQAVGMVNDHLVSCFRHAEVRRLADQQPLNSPERVGRASSRAALAEGSHRLVGASPHQLRTRAGPPRRR